MRDPLPEILAYYRAFSSNILDDIALIEQDLEFLERGGQIYYCIDFSEIYSYANGAADRFFTDDRLIDALAEAPHRAELVELHEAIMQFILFDAQPQILVLAPYWVELYNYMAGLRSGILKNKSRTIAKAISQHASLPTSAEYDEFVALVSQSSERGSRLSGNKERLEELLLRIAPAILDLWQQTLEENALRRLVGLLERKKLMFASEMFSLEAPLEPEQERYEAWYVALNKRRRDRQGQNFIDAEAIGLLYAINTILGERTPPVMLQLVTRSKTMASIMRWESQNGVWDKAGNNIIRHPRGFLTWVTDTYDIDLSAMGAHRRQSVSRWKRSFQKIAGTERQPARGEADLTETETLRRQVAYLADFWRKYCGLNLSRVEALTQLPDENILVKALAAITDRHLLHDAISDVIARLQTLLDKVHFSLRNALSRNVVSAYRLAEVVHSRNPAVAAPIEHGIHSEMRVRLFSAHGVPLPFCVYIQNPRLCGEMKEYFQEPHRVLEVLVNDPLLPDKEAESTKPSDEEWYLALSCAHAALGTWEMAMRSAEFAREEVKLKDGSGSVTYLEALYIIAKAIRHLEHGGDELRLVATELRDAAGVNECDHKLSAECLNPYKVRFVSEYFKVQCVLLRKLYDGSVAAREGEIARIGGIITSVANAIKQQEDQIGNDAEYVDLLNNICFHFTQYDVMRRAIMGVPTITYFYAQMMTIGTTVFGNLEAWPDKYVDTVCWVGYILMAKGAIPHLEKAEFERSIISPLEVLSRREFVSDVDKRDFIQHRDEVREYLEARFVDA